MQNDPIIRVSGLSKKYLVGHDSVRRDRYRSLREEVVRHVKTFGRNAVHMVRGRQLLHTDEVEEFWALKDVSFEVEPGEVIGIIGRNGAGKSTLLKVLSRITEPTEGRVEINGRVSSLLEVGTGFHPELTGRENIFLNGAILGMKRAEIVRKFDEIVDFAEIEKFIDTPVKRYSSGMYVRLAFAVAAHLEPEILLVDEVLAVGDISFQQKCLGKMRDVSALGRTIIFVSHNTAAIARLCNRCLVLDRGRPIYDGHTRTAISQYYMPSEVVEAQASYSAPSGRTGPHVVSARVETSDPGGYHDHGKPLVFEFHISVPTSCSGLCFSFQIVNEDSVPVCHFWLLNSDAPFGATPGVRRLRCEVPCPRLYMGTYTLTTWLSDRRGSQLLLESLKEVCKFRVKMLGISREQYDWQPGECTYLEDGTWSVEPGACEDEKTRHQPRQVSSYAWGTAGVGEE